MHCHAPVVPDIEVDECMEIQGEVGTDDLRRGQGIPVLLGKRQRAGFAEAVVLEA